MLRPSFQNNTKYTDPYYKLQLVSLWHPPHFLRPVRILRTPNNENVFSFRRNASNYAPCPRIRETRRPKVRPAQIKTRVRRIGTAVEKRKRARQEGCALRAVVVRGPRVVTAPPLTRVGDIVCLCPNLESTSMVMFPQDSTQRYPRAGFKARTDCRGRSRVIRWGDKS